VWVLKRILFNWVLPWCSDFFVTMWHRSMEVIGSLLTFCNRTFWSLVIDIYIYIYIYICYLREDDCIKILFMKYCRMFLLEIRCMDFTKYMVCLFMFHILKHLLTDVCSRLCRKKIVVVLFILWVEIFEYACLYSLWYTGFFVCMLYWVNDKIYMMCCAYADCGLSYLTQPTRIRHDE
jgi:hypothetical protein